MLVMRPRPSAGEARCREARCSGAPILATLFVASVLVLTLFAPGCRDEIALSTNRNLPPETLLTGAPGDSQTSVYFAHLHWLGTDPDGAVVGYEWAVTESLPDPRTIEYRYTSKTDSIFAFQVESNREVLGHRFYVRAIDNEGEVDETPAYTFFAARNTCVPEVVYTRSFARLPGGALRAITGTQERGPTDTIPAGSSVEFAWRGEDCDVIVNPDGSIEQVGRVVSYTYKLTPLEIGEIRGGLGDTTISYGAERLSSGRFAMAVRAVDDAGFAGLDPARRTFVWNYDPQTTFARIARPGFGDSVPAFYADSSADGVPSFEPFVDLDTLPLLAGGVDLQASVRGFDRDAPDGLGGVARFQARLLRQGDSGPWQTLDPVTRLFSAERLFSGNYILTARVQDGYGREDGSPDTLRIFVNRPPRFITRGTEFDPEFEQIPLPGEVLELAEGDSVLFLQFAARDPDPIGLPPGLEFRSRFTSYPLANGEQGQQSFFCPWVFDEFSGSVRLFTRLNCGDGATPSFPEGEYEITVEVREYRLPEEQDYGTRTAVRRVPFRLVLR